MLALNPLMIALGGALGALFRYVTVSTTQFLIGSQFPFGTLLVNSIGSFLIGLIMTFMMDRLILTETVRLFIIIGFLGGFTTFSSLTWESWSLYQNGQWFYALLNIILNNFLGLLLLMFGVILGRAIV